jgi:enterochelin esterase family protein
MQSLLSRARETGTPIVDGASVTFLWEGDEPPYLAADFNGWEPEPPGSWSRAGVGLWARTTQLPPDAYIEYALLAEPSDDARVPDPFNDRTTPNGLGHVNHYFYMPGAEPTPLTERRRGIPQGKVTRHRIENDWLLANGVRRVHLYHPVTSDPVPLLVVFDGEDYRTRARIAHIVDNLVAQRRIRPIALALVENGGRARGVEYLCSDATAGFILTDVLSLAQARLNLLDPAAHPGAYGVLGASMGGLMATYLGVRAPEVFGHVISQSGAFELAETETVLHTLIRHGPAPAAKMWLDVGRYEWLLEPNRRMVSLMTEHGYDVTYREYHGGHNYPSWRDDLWRGLEHHFGPANRSG